MNDENKEIKDNTSDKIRTIFGLIIALIPILLFVFALVTSRGSMNSNDGITWLGFFFYYAWLYPIGSVISFFLSISSFGTKWQKVGIVSIMLLIVPFILFTLIIPVLG